MTDLIAKIGRFFAEQEAQIQETFTQAAHAPIRALSKPPPPVHRIPTHLKAHPPEFGRGSPSTNLIPKPSPISSHVRRRFSLKSTVEPTVTLQPQSWQEGINEILDTVPLQRKLPEMSLLKASVPLLPSRRSLSADEIWHHQLSGELDSWRSSSSPASTLSGRGTSAKDEDFATKTNSDTRERQRKPRPPHQKHRKRSRKKKSSNNNQEEERPDPKEMAKENAEKVAAALVLAQERAKRIQQEKQQHEREQELERQEATFRVQEQMIKIEAVRARSFRQLSSTVSTARSSLSNSESGANNHDMESVCTADTNDLMEPQNQPSEFMMELKTQLWEKMSLEMHVKRSYTEKHKQRERIRLRLDKIRQQNAVQSSKVARLSAVKASLEMELAAVLEETAQTRQQRRELEHADEKERLKRQREAERTLQTRLREEEWSSMMEEEKVRSQLAAEARAKASKRVEARSAKLRQMMQTYLYEPRQASSSGVSSSARCSNNGSDHSDDESSRTSTENLVAKPPQLFKMALFLPPELADFEEEGLCHNTETDGSFRWQVPSFSDQVKFTKVLQDMLSDDEN